MAKPHDATLASILAEHGPLDEDAIVERLREHGGPDPEFAFEQALETGCPAGLLVDGRWAWLPTVLAGRVFTHRLGADELAHDFLTVIPDLDPITVLCDHEQYQHLADGSPARIDPSGALLLAPGTLAALGVAEGDLVGVRLAEAGLVVERVTAPAECAVGARLAAMLDADEPILIDAAVWTACVEDPALFTEPLPPLGEIVDDYGLARSVDWLAPGGFDFDRWRLEFGCAMLAERHDIDADDAFALYVLVKLYEQIAEGAEVETSEPDVFAEVVGELGVALADPEVAELLIAETVGVGGGAAALGVFADMLEPKVPRAAQVACRWLRAVALERIGDIEAAERELLAAESRDPDWPLALRDLARIASDRGDAERGLALLRRAGAEPDDPLVEVLERYRAEPRRDLGRNELCWCGSGRKYKKCHLGREQLPLSERAGWLYAKAVQYALQGEWDDLLVDVGYKRYRHSELPDDFDMLADPLVVDAVLFEGDAFADFLEVRGSLLPEDERLLAEQWLLVQRSVFEIEQVQPGQGLTVRDVRTGDTHDVRERTASRKLEPGQLICARVVPAGDTMQFFGGIEPVALHERDLLIDVLDSGPDPVTLVAQLSRRFATQ